MTNPNLLLTSGNEMPTGIDNLSRGSHSFVGPPQKWHDYNLLFMMLVLSKTDSLTSFRMGRCIVKSLFFIQVVHAPGFKLDKTNREEMIKLS